MAVTMIFVSAITTDKLNGEKMTIDFAYLPWFSEFYFQ